MLASIRRRTGRLLVIGPPYLWLLIFFLAPLAAFILYSFLTAGLFSVSGPLTLDAYRQAVSSGVIGTLAVN